MLISIIKADYIDQYKIKILFSTNEEKIVDFGNFLKNAKNPMTKKYLNESKFKDFKIIYGDLIWNDYELCFPIWDVYTENLT